MAHTLGRPQIGAADGCYAGAMPKVFGFNEDELKLLLVAVRQMRRTFSAALQRTSDPSLEAYAKLYDDLFEKLRDMAGPIPEALEETLE